MVLLLAACQGQPVREGTLPSREFTLSDMAKGDIDMVAEVSFRHTEDYLRELAQKLYRRNPNQLLRAHGGPLVREQALQRLFEPGGGERSQLGGRVGAEAIALAFDDSFCGDRVAALVAGLRDMSRSAYGGNGEFFLPHRFDPQKLYFLARNFEIASWRLRTKRQADGRLFLLSTGQGADGTANTSFERLFGKMIAVQDHLAGVIADTTNRQIKNVIQGVASAVFFPL